MAIASISAKSQTNTHPFASPQANAADTGLHSPEGAAIATFLGGPIAGAIIIAANCLKLNEILNAVLSLFVGCFAAIVLTSAALSFSLPPALGTFVGLSMAFLVKQISKSMFSDSIDDQLDAGIRPQSTWLGAIVGLIALATQVGILVVIL